MKPIKTPLSIALLDIATSFLPEPIEIAGFDALVAELDRTNLYIDGYRLIDTEEGELIQLLLPPLLFDELVIAFPSLSQLSFVIYPAAWGTQPVLEILHPYSQLPHLQIDNLKFAIRLDTDLLRPVDDTHYAELSYSGGIRINHNATVALVGDQSLTLPPCEIANSGIVIGFTGVQFDFSDQTAVPGIQALGLPPTFRGIYGRHVHISVLPQSIFGDTPGLSLDFHDVAIGNSGISFKVGKYYELIHTDDEIDPNSGMVGYLFHPDWQIALIAAEVELRDSVVEHFAVAGAFRIPLLNSLFRVRFDLQQGIGGYQYTLALTTLNQTIIPIGHGSLTFETFSLSGTLMPEGFAISGAIQNAVLDLGAPIQLTIGQASIALSHNDQFTAFNLELLDVPLGPLGTVENATLHYTQLANGQLSLQLSTQLTWADLRHRLSLDAIADIDGFPMPPDDGEITAFLSWIGQDNGGYQLVLRFSTEVTGLHNLWSFIPNAYQPQVNQFNFIFEATYETAEFQSATTDDTFAGKISVEAQVKLPDLPDLPGMELIQIETGNDQGLLTANITAVLDGEGNPSFTASIYDGVGIGIHFPGIPQPQPPIQVAMTRVDVKTSLTEQTTLGEFFLSGTFALHPLLPPEEFIPIPMRPLLQTLLPSEPFSGTADIRLSFANGRSAMSLDCTFDEAQIDLDIFDMLYNLSRGLATPDDLATANAIDLDLDVSFRLIGIGLQMGSLTTEEDSGHFGLQLRIGFHMTGLPQEITVMFSLSNQEFSLGFDTFAIPLSVPHFPLTANDLAAVADSEGLWQYALWQSERRQLNQEITTLKQTPERTKEQDERLASLQLHKFMLQSIFAVYERLNANHALYQTYVEATVAAMTAVTGALHIDTTLAFELRDVQFVIPFENPQDIRVEGGAGFVGLADDDPLEALESLTLKLGLSADYIFFSVEGGGDIPLPNFGIERYSGGSVNLKELRLGYGYTKNSFSFAFAGELEIPATLRHDLNTSQQIGFGLLPPTHTRLAFKIDLIPVVLGPVDFVIPLFDFNLDMRRPLSQGLLDAATCTPDWDGLELIIPGIVHADMKRIAFSPMFGFFPLPNVQYDYDFDIGNDQMGYTVVVDNMLIISGFMGIYRLPFVADGFTPFMDNLCIDIRLAGFGIHFNIQRPFPSLSPLILFELLGLLSDPLMPIDPNGPLANTIRFTLQNGAIHVPPFVLRLFPDLDAVVNREFNITINLGTFITAQQQFLQTLNQLITAVTTASQKLSNQLADIAANPPKLNLGTLLAAVPPELRKMRTGGALAGFEATAVLLLITPEDALTELTARDADEPPLEEDPDPSIRFDTLLYQTSFIKPLRGWRVIDEEDGKQRSNWHIKDGTLRQTSPIRGTYFIQEQHQLATQQLVVTLRPMSKEGTAGVLFRFQDSHNHYRLVVGGWPRRYQLIKVQEGQVSLLYEDIRSPNEPTDAVYELVIQTIDHHFIIGINGARWVEGVDEGQPIEKGNIGFYTYANTQAAFGEVRLYAPGNGRSAPFRLIIISRPASHPFQPTPRFLQAETTSQDPRNPNHPFRQLPEPTALYQTSQPNVKPLSGQRLHDPEDPQNNLFKGIEFNAFTTADLSAIPLPDGELSGIVIGAHVKVFNGQRFRFLGYLYGNGAFGLITALEIRPLKLVVLGIEMALPLEINGRLHLNGRSKRDGVIGSITAQGNAIWKVLPGNVLILHVGGGSHTVAEAETLAQIAQRYGQTEDDLRQYNQLSGKVKTDQTLSFPPAHLQLHSNGRFALKGAVQLIFFNGAATLGGWVDISHSHCFTGGWFTFTAGPQGKPPIIQLGLACEGRIGPGPHFLLKGAGNLTLMGHTLTHVSGEISETHAAITANLDTHNWLSLINSRVFLKLQGQIDIAKPLDPTFDLSGEGYIKVGHARVDGAGGIKRTKRGAIATYLAGGLKWGTHRWLEGRVEIGTNGAQINGRASFALDLTPSQLPGNIQVASLFLKVDMEGAFTFSSQSGFASAKLDVNWLLGVRLADTSQQTLPLAMQQQTIDLSVGTPSRRLLHVEGFKLLPFDTPNSIQIPIPIIKQKPGGKRVRFGTINDNPAIRLAPTTLEMVMGLVPIIHGATLDETYRTFPLEIETSYEYFDFPLDSSFELFMLWDTNKQRPRLRIKTSTNSEYFL